MDLKKDSVIFVFIILNVVGLIFLFTYINSLNSNKSVEPKPKEPIVSKQMTTNCSIDKQIEGLLDTEEITLFHTDNLLDKYTVKYNLSLYDEKGKETFDLRKMNAIETISQYSNEPSIIIGENIDNDINYSISYTKDLSIPYNRLDLNPLFNYKSDINESINNLIIQGYICN